MTTVDTFEIALLARLIECGAAQESARTLDLIHRYEKACWLMPSSRRGEWIIRDGVMVALKDRLARLLPQWENDFNLLGAHGLDPKKPQDIEALPALRMSPTATGMVNRRNWTAAGGLGPKRKGVLDTEATLTSDWVMRLRPNRGLIANWAEHSADLWDMSSIWTECPIPQRKWLGFQSFTGVLPATIITCENLGAYIDLPLPEDALCVFSPGTHIEYAVELLNGLPDANWVHFGDIDPEGLAIGDQISAAAGREVRRYIPSFCMEYLERDMAQKKNVQWEATSGHPIMEMLAVRREGVFQEVFMLDDRLGDDIRSFCTQTLNRRNSSADSSAWHP